MPLTRDQKSSSFVRERSIFMLDAQEERLKSMRDL